MYGTFGGIFGCAPVGGDWGLESWVEDFTQTIETVQNDLKDIDSTGHFESDDEVGTIFKQIKETVNQLESYRGEDVDAS